MRRSVRAAVDLRTYPWKENSNGQQRSRNDAPTGDQIGEYAEENGEEQDRRKSREEEKVEAATCGRCTLRASPRAVDEAGPLIGMRGYGLTSPGQRWNASLYDDAHAFVWKAAASLLELLDPKAGERILDLGCGTGHLTAQIAARGATVIGLDNSQEMIGSARRLYPQIQFTVGDARTFAFDPAFDAVFSNAALHWIKEPDDIVQRIGSA